MKAAPYEPGARIDGGIPLCVPEIRGNEWKYVKDCLDTGWVSSVGAYVTKFEDAVARACDMPYAVATVNGTAALHLALLCAGVEPGDEVLVSTLTFIAPANAIRYAGARPVFIDAEPNYWQMNPDAVERFLTEECSWDGAVLRDRATGARVSAIVPVDILGSPADMDPILDLARQFNLAIVEDATESLGAAYKGHPVGKLAGLACLSFNGNKLLTTGGGGMIVTDNAVTAKRARYLSTQAKDDPIEYVHGAIGYNYRLTNVQAAVGVAQMECLSEFLAAKRAHARRYTELLDGVPGITPMPEAPYASSAFWMYTILVDADRFGKTSRDLLRELAAANIQARPLWQPGHLSPSQAPARAFEGTVAERLCRESLSLPSSVGLTPEELEAVARAVRDAYKG